MDALDEPWWCNLGVQVLYVKVVFSYYLCCCVDPWKNDNITCDADSTFK